MEQIHVQQPYFDYIKTGRKTIDGRINKGKFAHLTEGQMIKILCDDEFVTAYIVEIKRYHTFKEYLMCEGLPNTLPGINTVEDGCDVYYQYYTQQQEEEHGVLALHLLVIV